VARLLDDQARYLGRRQREELAAAFYTQLLPSSTYRIRPQLRQLVYQAMTG
jgi:hypothetical protein